MSAPVGSTRWRAGSRRRRQAVLPALGQAENAQLLFTVAGEGYACPVARVEKLLRREDADILLVDEPELACLEGVLHFADAMWPVVSPHRLWSLPPTPAAATGRMLILLRGADGAKFALAVDGCQGVVKSLPARARRYAVPAATRIAGGNVFGELIPWQGRLLATFDADQLLSPAMLQQIKETITMKYKPVVQDAKLQELRRREAHLLHQPDVEGCLQLATEYAAAGLAKESERLIQVAEQLEQGGPPEVKRPEAEPPARAATRPDEPDTKDSKLPELRLREARLVRQPDVAGYLQLAAEYSDAGLAKESERLIRVAEQIEHGGQQEAEHLFSGIASRDMLAEVLQVLARQQHSGDLVLEAPGQTSHFYLADGELIHATSLNHEPGVPSLEAALAHAHGQYRFFKRELPGMERTIHESMDTLLLNAYHMIDQQAVGMGDPLTTA